MHCQLYSDKRMLLNIKQNRTSRTVGLCQELMNTQAEQQQEQDEQEDNESTLNTSMTSNRSSDRRVAWSGLLICKSVEKESHYNDDREIWSRLKNWIVLPSRQCINADESIFESWISGKYSNYKQDSHIGNEWLSQAQQLRSGCTRIWQSILWQKRHSKNFWNLLFKEKISDHLWSRQRNKMLLYCS